MARSNQTMKQVLAGTPFGKVKVPEMMKVFKVGQHHFGFNLTRVHGMVGAIRYANISRIRN